jgi:hypothetical protein
MFANIKEKTFYIFGIANVITLPMVWGLYPESNQRTLEEMDLVFAADTPWVWDAERNFKKLSEENPQLVQAARRGQSVVDPETGLPRSRKQSFAAVYEGQNGTLNGHTEKGEKGFSEHA